MELAISFKGGRVEVRQITAGLALRNGMKFQLCHCNVEIIFYNYYLNLFGNQYAILLIAYE
jgi:hypothetical protein